MEEGDIVEWAVEEGEHVAIGDPVVMFETDKMISEVTAEQEGVLLEKQVQEGETVAVGTELGRIGDETEVEEPAEAVDEADGTAADETASQNEDSDASATPVDQEGLPPSVRATPKARRIARERGVSLVDVAAATNTNQLTPNHVERFAEGTQRESRSESESTGGRTAATGGVAEDPSAGASPADLVQPEDATVLGTPRARVVANAHAVDVQTVGEALGVERVREADVHSYLEQAETESNVGESPSTQESERGPDVAALDDAGSRGPPAVTREDPLSGASGVMFERMSEVNDEYADTTTVARVDVTELLDLYEQLADAWEDNLSLTAFVVRAVATTLPEYEELNAAVTDDETLRLFEDINIGIAVNADDGLLVPTVYAADQRSLRAISQDIDRLADAARSRDLDHDDLQNGTFTVSNAGSLGAYINTPQINPPQTAILGVCTVFDEAGVVDGEVVPRKMMHLCLTYDHRVVEGANAVGFLQDVKRKLENPASLLS